MKNKKPTMADLPVRTFYTDSLHRAVAARLAQLAERKALNLVVMGSSPTVGDILTAARPLALGPQRQVAACPLSLSLCLSAWRAQRHSTHTQTAHGERDSSFDELCSGSVCANWRGARAISRPLRRHDRPRGARGCSSLSC